ncbi:MAG: FAD-dependent thymidylate synthase [Acidobacteria bacterium]|nr:FAD-dependent thymidylate synthase [Acidobacteriota bacterium]
MSAAETPSLSALAGDSSAAPRVTLRNYFPHAYDSAIAAARTCYATRLITPDEISEKQRVSIGPATFNGGHHTVYQHAHFEFGLENVSRQFVWNFLHSHPFYNSEQQSQRYVRLDRAHAFLPPLIGEARAVYAQAIERAWERYRELSAKLIPRTRETLYQVWKIGPNTDDRRRRRIEQQVEKKAIEVARYVLPLAAHTTLVHTVSGIVLHRMSRMRHSGDTPHETALVMDQMVARVKEVEPEFFDRIGSGPLEEDKIPETRLAVSADPRRSRNEFDSALGGRTSKVISIDANAERVAAQAVRYVLGLSESEMDDDCALDELLNPARNRYRLETLNVSMHSPMMRALEHVQYTFQKKISHTADSQDQRHRMVPASRPLLAATDCPEPDYLTPMLIRGNAEVEPLYTQAMEEAWAAKNKLLALGVPKEFAVYVLPNATAVRLVESGSLLHLLHKWTMRTCFNAQEEIYFASMEELDQIRAAHPRLMRYVGPPCVVRKGNAYPVCTEGSHFCGVKVWENFPHAQRLL